MAGHLLKCGNSVKVFARTPSKAMSLVSQGAIAVDGIPDLVKDTDAVFLCVTRSEDVEECLGALVPHATPGTLFVDHSTIAPDAAKRLHSDLESVGLAFVDAPVTGGSMGAQKGQLTIFCGGKREAFERALPLMSAYAKRAEYVGGPGAGQTMKLANQIAVGGSLLALCESLAFAEKAGLDLAQTRDVLASGAAGSWAFDNYGPKILARDWSPGFSVKNQRKDFGYTIHAAEELGAAVPGTRLVDRLLAELDGQGHGEWTTAALFDVLVRSDPDSWK